MYKKREYHGLTNHPLYSRWNQIKQRCFNPNYTGYHLYGGRGISMEPDWAASFQTFFDDVGCPPSPQHTLDRVDNSKGYVRGNMRWATPEEQAHNRRTNRYFTHNGETKPLAKWAKDLGLPYSMLRGRADRGLQPPELFDPEPITPKKPEFFVEVDGQMMTIKEAVELTGISRSTLYYRYRKGTKICS